MSEKCRDARDKVIETLNAKADRVIKQRDRLLKLVRDAVQLIGADVRTECTDKQCPDCNWLRRAKKEIRSK